MRGETLKTLDEKNQRMSEARSDIFVYAGFIKPGKHQIMIKDKSGSMYVREIVVDIRRKDIETCNAPNLYKRTNGIIKGKNKNNEDIIDLDGSVFMNFKRYTKQNILDCLKADMSRSVLEDLVDD